MTPTTVQEFLTNGKCLLLRSPECWSTGLTQPPRAWQMAPVGPQEAGGPGGTSLHPVAGKGSADPSETDGLSSNPTPGCDLASPVSEKGDGHSSCQLGHGEGLNAEPALTALGFVPSGHSAVLLWPPPHMLQHMLHLHKVLLCRRTSMTFHCDCSYVIVCYSAMA